MPSLTHLVRLFSLLSRVLFSLAEAVANLFTHRLWVCEWIVVDIDEFHFDQQKEEMEMKMERKDFDRWGRTYISSSFFLTYILSSSSFVYWLICLSYHCHWEAKEKTIIVPWNQRFKVGYGWWSGTGDYLLKSVTITREHGRARTPRRAPSTSKVSDTSPWVYSLHQMALIPH